jgi:hypothetical protein
MSDPRNSPAFLPTDSDDCQMNLTSTSHSIQIPNSGSSSHYTIRASDATNQPLSSPSVNDFASGGQWGFLDEPGPEVFSVSVDEHLPQGWSMVEHSTSNNHVQNHNYAASFTTENSAMDEIYADVHSEALPIRQPGSTRNDYMDTEPQVNEFNDRLIPNDGDFLREDGRMPVVPYRKGSRKGPLEARKKGVTAERRKNKSVCIRCQTMRIEVGYIYLLTKVLYSIICSVIVTAPIPVLDALKQTNPIHSYSPVLTRTSTNLSRPAPAITFVRSILTRTRMTLEARELNVPLRTTCYDDFGHAATHSISE